MHIYAFGSICRGEIDKGSDIDLLALVDGIDNRFDKNMYSIYSYSRIKELWQEGNPFAWHLALEAKCLFSSDGKDFLKSLGQPNEYTQTMTDCMKFYNVFLSALESIRNSNHAIIFDLSSIFLAIRNIATCYSLSYLEKPTFSRDSALLIGDERLKIDKSIYDTLENCRILCTRGKGDIPNKTDIEGVIFAIEQIQKWISLTINKVKEKQYE